VAVGRSIASRPDKFSSRSAGAQVNLHGKSFIIN